MKIINSLADELQLQPAQVAATAALLDDGNTIPFIARYRKEATGGLDEEVLRRLQARLDYLRNLEQRQDEVLRLVGEQGNLTPQWEARVRAATTLQAVEDLYRPFRPRRRTRAGVARERGLEPLALALWQSVDAPALPAVTAAAAAADAGAVAAWVQAMAAADPAGVAAQFVDPAGEVPTAADALAGASDIVAEWVAEDPDIRSAVRDLTARLGRLTSRAVDPTVRSPYEMYYDYAEPLRAVRPHRVLAMGRGEREGMLHVGIAAPEAEAVAAIEARLIRRQSGAAAAVAAAIADGYRRLLGPAIERELRAQLTEMAEERAIQVFAENLNHLLLQAPVRGRTVLAIDPGYRTGCKLAVVDATGKLLETGVIYPHPPQQQADAARRALSRLCTRHGVEIIAIGNGTAARETETLVAGWLQADPAADGRVYTVVSEAGASVYSASPLAKEEFPNLDVSERSAISIGRRLQDPLAELVKIDPRSIGVGQYQHDVNQKRLGQTLGAVVESCVNRVGVDLNTASAALLQYVAGIRPQVARAIVGRREAAGPFRTRSELKQVRGLGDKASVQCAGFLRISGGDEPLDNTAVHPESYAAAEELLVGIGVGKDDLRRGGLPDIRSRLQGRPLAELAAALGVGEPTLNDIFDALARPGRDPREDLPGPLFRSDVLDMADLQTGMVLPGTVRNVVDFGAFVDIGVKRDGLVHVSELSDRYVRHPGEVVAVGQVVHVQVLEVDRERERIALTMKGVAQDAAL